jgi:type IV pilus assembly protein PilC
VAEKQKKTTNFSWAGTDRKGRKTSGQMAALDDVAVKASLRGQGIAVLKVRRASAFSFGEKGKAIKTKDIAIFTRQLATMLQAGVPLVQSLDIVARGDSNPRMQELLGSVKNSVESGNSLTESFAKHPKYFDDLYVNLVDAGEKSGALEGLLEKIATYKEKTEALKSKIKKALFYPIAVVCVAIIVTAILLLFVVPQFEDLFKGFGADLPALTQFVVNLSRWLQSSWWIYLIIMFGTGTAIKMLFARSEKARDLQDEYMLKLPVVGDILMKSAIARFTRTLETMFAAGIPLVEAMDSVAGATGNAVYEKATYEVRDEIATGQPLQVAMTQTGVFPNLAVQMIAIGEESGALDQMAGKVAEFYEQEVDAAVDGLTSLLEPLIMTVLGVLVGGLIIAMYLPIFKLGSVVG